VVDSKRDPRTHVTDHAFQVAPELLGRSLARPWRRGVAMLVDGMAIALLANASSVFFGLAVAVVLFRVANPRRVGAIGRWALWPVRLVAAILVFAFAISAFEGTFGRFGGSRTGETATASGPRAVTGTAGLLVGADLLALRSASDEAEVRRRAERVSEQLAAAGVRRSEIAELLVEVAGERPDRPWVRSVVDSLNAMVASEEAERAERATLSAASADSVVALYAGALASGRSDDAQRYRLDAVQALAGDTIAALEAVTERQRARLAALGEELTRKRGVVAVFHDIRRDLGLGLGWSGLYFTAFLVLWRGQTPGKRLMRIRVVRLDGLPVGWWAALERYGGYAAGIATGLLGFLQIFWDRNRQAIHDKISSTVVVRD
jgi:hypothetical protein